MSNTRKRKHPSQSSQSRFFPANESKHNQLAPPLKLFHAVTQADYEQAALMIDIDPSLIFERFNFCYCDGSSEYISPLQYAFKVYDTYMWRLFYESIRNNLAHLRLFLTQAQQQTMHINFEPLSIACKEFAELTQRPKVSKKNLDALWLKVGIIQRVLLPVHMLKEFSRKGEKYSWSPHAQFHAAVVPPTSCHSIYMRDIPRTASAILLEWGNGASFTLMRGTETQARCEPKAACAKNLLHDLNTFQYLLAVRAEELANKLSFIKNSLAENKQDQFALSHFPYKKLPHALISCIDRFLDIKTLSSRNQAMGHFRQHMDPIMQIPFGQKPILLRLLHDVIHADYEHVASLTDINLALLFKPIHFSCRDGSSEHISPLQYAFKVYDTHMWKLVYEKIKNNPAYVRLFLAQAQQQTTHVNLEPLYIVYKEYAKVCKEYRERRFTMDTQKSDALWIQETAVLWPKIGKVQRALLPAHMLKEFSRGGKKSSWQSLHPEFHAAIVPPPKNCLFFDHENKTDLRDLNKGKTLAAVYLNWDKGSSFTLVGGTYPRVRICRQTEFEHHLLHDLKTFQHLLAVRAEELAEQLSLIKNSLESPEQQPQNLPTTCRAAP